MSREKKIHSGEDSFADVLHSEIIAGSENLTAWIKQIQEQGAIENLFEMETWIKGIRSFFGIDHLPLTAVDRSEIVARNFLPEMRVVRQAILTCESCACEVMKPKVGEKLEFEEFLDIQMRKDRMADFHISRMVEQLTPADSLAQLMVSLNDFRIAVDAYRELDVMDYQLFLSMGRAFERELKNCRYIDMLMSQRFRLQYDLIENKSLANVLQSIQEDAVRRNIALALLYLFRFQKYLDLVHIALDKDRPLKQFLVIFSLLHEEMGILSDFLRARFLRNRDAGNSLRNAADLIAYSLKTDAQRVMENELIYIARETNPVPVYTRIENSHGLLRNCCQSGILTLIQSLDKDFDPAILFPSRTDNLISSERLRQSLWDLRQWLTDVLSNKEDLDSNKIIERLALFKDASLRSLMYRDWAEFEAFSDALAISTNFIEIRTHIRKFVGFLEMLIQEVSKRSIFQDKTPHT
ncbi:MAG: hypothetical protein JXA73_25400 [Acidobacteria bacterium]|nr:hypothetical protein [Acidobacteriota bacterium]